MIGKAGRKSAGSYPAAADDFKTKSHLI